MNQIKSSSFIHKYWWHPEKCSWDNMISNGVKSNRIRTKCSMMKCIHIFQGSKKLNLYLRQLSRISEIKNMCSSIFNRPFFKNNWLIWTSQSSSFLADKHVRKIKFNIMCQIKILCLRYQNFNKRVFLMISMISWLHYKNRCKILKLNPRKG